LERFLEQTEIQVAQYSRGEGEIIGGTVRRELLNEPKTALIRSHLSALALRRRS
jgi:hypothetical protein